MECELVGKSDRLRKKRIRIIQYKKKRRDTYESR